jgi:hypothetical protein
MPGALTRKRVLLAITAVVVGLLVFAGVRLVRAGHAAQDGKSALLSAAEDVRARRMSAAETHLQVARSDFGRTRRGLSANPLLALARVTPLLRVQVRAMDTMAEAGESTADAGLALMPTAQRILAPAGGSSAEVAMRELPASRPQVDSAVAALATSQRNLRALDGYRLLGPLASAHRQLETRLDEAVQMGRSGQQTLAVLLDLAGAKRPSSYLLLSQNPDEPRPTGGYMGTYGVLTGRSGRVSIDRYGAMGQWNVQHPQAAIPAAQAPFPFRYATPPHPQSLGNANATPDWPASAGLAARIWQRGGEERVDGVVTFTPVLLTRLLAVVGPTRVPGYRDVVTDATVDSRLEFYVHGEASIGKDSATRKEFVGALAHAVLDRALHAPPAKLPDLGRALAAALSHREAAIWSRTADVQKAIEGLGWDGALPDASGDFYADTEFAFASKNGRHLLRTFDHTVTLAPDGSGLSDTTMVLRDTAPYTPGSNIDSHAYITPYGSQGGALLPSSDVADQAEASIAGHPTAGYLRTAQPLGQTRLHVGWQAPDLMLRRSDGTWEYRLTWLPQPAHRGDVLRLEVKLPAGWRWLHGAPPAVVALDGPYRGHWVCVRPNR